MILPTTDHELQTTTAALILTNKVDELIEDPDALLDGYNCTVWITPLHYAARIGDASLTSLLLRTGSKVYSRIVVRPEPDDSDYDELVPGWDWGDVTPLSLALAFGHAHVASILKAHGGEVKEGYFEKGEVLCPGWYQDRDHLEAYGYALGALLHRSMPWRERCLWW